MSENQADETPRSPDESQPQENTSPEPEEMQTPGEHTELDADLSEPAGPQAPAAPSVPPLVVQELPLVARVEGLLFVASEAVAPSQLAEALDVNVSSVEVALKDLERDLRQRGLRLQRHSGRVQLTTAPELASAIELFLGLESTSRLTRAALETLAIIAYQQPITHPQIDSIRGVNSDSMLKSLLNKGLIYEAGRTDGPGRPILYVTAPTFLQHLGLNSIAELPSLEIAQETPGHDEMLKG
jgi:segregation and condensation protein B